ncbi:hypothetical protein TSUD_67870 [Trifolium subterraneum]|uniref:Pentatricopeptide repeat-containing protein n=1 Tax=Trifolium subterraneum TaxID=3900 RepID=A0A2Z6N2J9_TRISU|nr:hypothetical protein TSUD_67870 [Trifolium subterraneum]
MIYFFCGTFSTLLPAITLLAFLMLGFSIHSFDHSRLWGGEGKAALEVFNKFPVFHCVPNHDTYYFTLQALLNTSCSPDMIHQAASICQNMMLLLSHDHHDGGFWRWKILEEAKKKDSKLTVALVYHALIVGYCNLQQFDRALKLLTEMKDFGVSYTNLDEYPKLIHSFCLMDMEWKMAIEQLEEMESMDREMVENQLNIMPAKNRQMAEERLEEMSEEQLEEVRISMQKYLS